MEKRKEKTTKPKGKPHTSEKKKPCEKVATNDPSWYLRDGTPKFSGEFDDLQKIGVIQRVLPNGVQLDTAVQHLMVVAPPVDAEASQYKQAATLLSKVRKKNTGANIYQTMDVLVYLWKIDCAIAAFAEISREIAAVSHIMPGNADSPWAALNIVNASRNWESEASVLADTKNEADIVAKMIDALPCPDHAMIDRLCNLFHNTFADSKGGKPSFTTFLPGRIVDLSVSNGVATPVVRQPNSGTISSSLQVVRDILDDIYTDNGANFTMLRGDLIKLFAPKPRAMQMLYQPLQLKAMSAELASQIENATILGRVSSYDPNDLVATVADTGNTLTLPLSGILNPDIDCKGELNEQPINSRGGVPSDGELMAITSLMPIVEQVNGATTSKWNVLAHNGVVLWDSSALPVTARNSGITGISIGQQLADVHSSVQSTMKAAYTTLQWVKSIIAHSPMFITDDQDPKGFLWDVDYVGLITKSSLDTAITRVVRSLFQVNLPERD